MKLQGLYSDWKLGKMGRHFPVKEKSGNFEHTGEVRENQTGKLQEFETNVICFF